MFPSIRSVVTLSVRIGAPPTRRSVMPSNIACMMLGTPGSTNTFSSWNPGAPLTGLSMSRAPAGISAMRSRASLRRPGS
ncbi:hypothetical protein D3C83_26250 [compost metagenome]